MADPKVVELRNIVKSFRVSELTVLLNFAGRNKQGRKSELKERALALCSRSCTDAIAVKIHELNKKRPNVSTSSGGGGSSSPHSASTASTSKLTVDKVVTSARAQLSEVEGLVRATSDVPVATSFVPSTSAYVPNTNPTVKLVSSMLAGSMTHAGLTPPSQMLVHPDVRFKRLPFYDYLHELVKPSCLSVRGGLCFQENIFSFYFTPQQALDVGRSRFIANEFIEDFGIQVLLRFCLSETTCEQEDNFPSTVSVRVNGKLAQLPNTIPSNKPGVEPKRPGRPVDITHYCKLVATEANRIEVTWSTDHIRNYCLMVSLERRLDSNTLLSRLKQKGLKHPDITRALIKEKLASNSDTEIATTSLRISLICPLGKMRMLLPTRSLGCSHLQCFDAPTYIHMNEKKSSWLCPICDRPAEFNNLFIDGLFTEILSKTSDTNDIEFTASGTWSPVMRKAEKCNIDDSILVQTIDDDCADDVKPCCIDLTETDDEEEEVQRPSRPVSSYSLSSDSTVATEYTRPFTFNFVPPSLDKPASMAEASATCSSHIPYAFNPGSLYAMLDAAEKSGNMEQDEPNPDTNNPPLPYLQRPSSSYTPMLDGPPPLSPFTLPPLWDCDQWMSGASTRVPPSASNSSASFGHGQLPGLDTLYSNDAINNYRIPIPAAAAAALGRPASASSNNSQSSLSSSSSLSAAAGSSRPSSAVSKSSAESKPSEQPENKSIAGHTPSSSDSGTSRPSSTTSSSQSTSSVSHASSVSQSAVGNSIADDTPPDLRVPLAAMEPASHSSVAPDVGRPSVRNASSFSDIDMSTPRSASPDSVDRRSVYNTSPDVISIDSE